jgi:hypothetical protein
LLYSLLVGPEPSDVEQEDFHISGGRFLEYTSKELSSQFVALSREARATLMSWPCLCMAEGRGEERVIVGRIVGVDSGGVGTVATVRKLPTVPALTNSAIWRLRAPLDIDQFEFHRHHWAIKERDLLGVMAAAGVALQPDDLATFSKLPLPAPDRQTLLLAKNRVGDWGHTEITDLLLEAGVQGLAAPATISRRDRANAILTYIFEHPSSTTAEGSLLSAFFVRKAGVVPEAEPRPERPTIVERAGVRAITPTEQRSTNRVFVVHGSNTAARASVVELLAQYGLQGIVLNEQPNMGRHLLTKFIEEAALTTFAIVLLTDDDVGGKVDKGLLPRARQNVILELGYFIAYLGQDKVCALKTPGLETPSDFDGIVYIAMDETGKWKEELYRELVAAKLPVRLA